MMDRFRTLMRWLPMQVPLVIPTNIVLRYRADIFSIQHLCYRRSGRSRQAQPPLDPPDVATGCQRTQLSVTDDHNFLKKIYFKILKKLFFGFCTSVVGTTTEAADRNLNRCSRDVKLKNGQIMLKNYKKASPNPRI